MRRLASLVLATVLVAGSAIASVTYSTVGSVYSQNFDTLPSTGSNATWTNNSTLPGWYLVISTGAAPTLIGVNNGSSTTGMFYSYGAVDNSERALGGLGSGGAYFGNATSGGVAGYWGVRFLNNTGLTLTQFGARYDVEQWRDQNTTQQPLVVEWAINPPDWLSGTWNAGTSTNSPQNSNAGQLDGNLPANRVPGVGFSVTSISWAHGAELWIRFRELNDAGNDQALAIDNFTFSAIPEPATASLLLSAGVLVALRRHVQSRRKTG